MVRKGNFEIRLIDAKVPFKEHHHDGKIYAEVEPNVEYFIQVRSHQKKKVLFYHEVDGKELGYQSKKHMKWLMSPKLFSRTHRIKNLMEFITTLIVHMI